MPALTNLLVSRSSSILHPSISGLLSPIQEPSDSEVGFGEIGKMNGVSIPGGGGYSPKNWVGRGCGPLLKTLNLFLTNFGDFSYPIYDLTLKSRPCFKRAAAL